VSIICVGEWNILLSRINESGRRKWVGSADRRLEGTRHKGNTNERWFFSSFSPLRISSGTLFACGGSHKVRLTGPNVKLTWLICNSWPTASMSATHASAVRLCCGSTCRPARCGTSEPPVFTSPTRPYNFCGPNLFCNLSRGKKRLRKAFQSGGAEYWKNTAMATITGCLK